MTVRTTTTRRTKIIMPDHKPPNPAEVRHMAKFILQELARFRSQPPFISYIQAKNHQPDQGGDPFDHFFISRHLRPSAPTPSANNVNYVSYKAPIGRLATVAPGKLRIVNIPMPSGIGAWQDTYTVLARDHFVVSHTDGTWDAQSNKVQFPETTEEEIASLIEFLAQPEIPFGPPKPKRRKATSKFELRDLAIVDAAQDEIFRLPIATFLLITGAPGTGKTTVAIKRLAQKAKVQYLLPEERASLSEDQLRPLFEGPNIWALYMPNELLRNYLKEALAQEELPASDDHLLVWKDHRITIARDALRYLKVGDRGFFRLGGDLLQCAESRRIAEWTLAFRHFFSIRVNEWFAADFANYAEAATAETAAIGNQIEAMEQQIEVLRRQAESITRTMSAEKEAAAQKDNQLRLENSDKERSNLSSQIRPFIRAKELWTQLVQAAAAANQPTTQLDPSRLTRVTMDILAQIQSQLPDPDKLPPSVRLLRSTIHELADKYSPNALIQRIPIVYHQFRLKENATFSFFKSAAMPQINDRSLDARELDTLIYTALLFIREAFVGTSLVQAVGDYPVQRLINEFRTIVVVDEAADFSATELACMYLLSNPTFNAVSFAGDLMQRMTREGLGSWTELSLLLPRYEDRPLRVSYRQSARLLRIAAGLYKKFIMELPPFDSAFAEDSADPAPLFFHGSDISITAEWLADRIIEIYQYNGDQLPSIAIFVSNETEIEQLHELIAPKLMEHSIDTDACFGGKVLGTQAKVRIFNIKFIKGLEFEAVFFTSVDEMARNEPGLLDKYLYVGLTRARNFLAVTYKDHFPGNIDFIKTQFQPGTWQSLVKGGQP